MVYCKLVRPVVLRKGEEGEREGREEEEEWRKRRRIGGEGGLEGGRWVGLQFRQVAACDCLPCLNHKLHCCRSCQKRDSIAQKRAGMFPGSC